jgi:hypothetical protein
LAFLSFSESLVSERDANSQEQGFEEKLAKVY